MEKYINIAARSLGVISALALCIMMFGTSIDVVARQIFDHPIPGIFEGVGLLLAVIVFFSLGYAQIERSHIKMEIIVSRLPLKAQKVFDFLAYLVSAVFLTLLFWYSMQQAIRSISIREFEMGLINIPIYIFRPAIPIGSAVFLIVVLLQMYRLFKAKSKD